MLENKTDNKNNIDGIEKASSEDINKSRRIVLDAIGERGIDEEPSKASADGVNKTTKSEDKKKSSAVKQKKEPPVNKEKKRYLLDEIGRRKDGSNRAGQSIAPNMLKNIQDQSEEENSSKKQPPKEAPAPEDKEASGKQGGEEKIKEEKKKSHKETARNEKIKKSSQREIIGNFREGFSRLRKTISSLAPGYFYPRDYRAGRFKKSAMNLLYLFFVAALAAIAVYSVFVLYVVRAHPDNQVVRYAAQYLPVPVLVSGDGIMEFYDYYDMKAQLASQGYSGDKAIDAIHLFFARKMAVNRLASNYKLLQTEGSFSRDKLSRVVVSDQAINLTASSRIKKIEDLIEEEGNFVEVANTFGDEFGQITLTRQNMRKLPQGEELWLLKKGEVSDVVAASDGYYLYSCFGSSENKRELSYVFIGAKTLDDYIDDYVRNCEVWSLAD